MNIKYCLPIIKNSKGEIFSIVKKNINTYNYFEVWLDYVDELDETFIKKLNELLSEKLIIVLRRKGLKSEKMSINERLEIISNLHSSRTILDLDISQIKELKHTQDASLNISTIISYHNYKNTPDDKTLTEIIDTMMKYSPTILKISTLCNTQSDALRLLRLLLELKKKNIKCIILGMGEYGVITRIFGTLWGNEMTFAPVRISDRSAEGQLTKKQFEKIFESLQKKYGR